MPRRQSLLLVLLATTALGAPGGAFVGRAAAQDGTAPQTSGPSQPPQNVQTLDQLIDFVIRPTQDAEDAPPAEDDIWNWDTKPEPSLIDAPVGPPLLGPTEDDLIGPPLAGPAPEELPVAERRVRRREREDDPFAPQGIRLGAFVIRPSIEIGGSWTDNVAGGADKKSAVGLVVAPDVNVHSEAERYEFDANLSGEATFYKDDAYDEQTAEARARLRYDLTTRTSIYTEAAYSRFLEGFSDPDTPASAAERPAVDTVEASLGVEQRFGRIAARATGFVERSTHEDVPLSGGGVASRKELDNTEVGLRVRAGYATSSALRPFGELTAGTRLFDQHTDDSGFQRSSVYGEARAGVVVDRGDKLSGEASVGYRHEDFEDGDLENLDAFLANASILWSPRRLTEVKVDLTTSVNPTSTPDTSATVLYAGTLTLSRSLTPRLTAEAGAGASYEDRIGDDYRDITFTGFAGASYAFNRNAALVGRYVYTRTDRNEPGGQYDSHEVNVRLRLQR